MNKNSLCPILFRLLVPGGDRWSTLKQLIGAETLCRAGPESLKKPIRVNAVKTPFVERVSVTNYNRQASTRAAAWRPVRMRPEPRRQARGRICACGAFEGRERRNRPLELNSAGPEA